jgi:hypothetical protein
MCENEPPDGWHEPEIAAYGPRVVILTPLAELGRSVFAAAAIAIVVLTTLFSYRTTSTLDKLRTHGRQVAAKATRTKEADGKSTNYYVEYWFRAGDRAYFDRERIDGDEYDDYAGHYKGYTGDQKVTVVYLPENPDTHVLGLVTPERVAGLRTNWIGYTAVGLMFLGMLYALFETTRREQAKRLANDFALPAMVDEIGASDGGKAPKRIVKFRYQNVDGKTESASRKLDGSISKYLEIGEPTTILMNPGNAADIRFLVTITLAEDV